MNSSQIAGEALDASGSWGKNDPRSMFENWEPIGRILQSHETDGLNALDVRELEKLSLPARQGILDNYRRIADIVDKHEGVIQNRWMKKSKRKRRDILLAAWPGMILYHRPEILAFKDTMFSPTGLAPDQTLAAFLWPHINVEDLSKPEPILLMLNSRGKNHPLVFFDLDWEVVRFASSFRARTRKPIQDFVMTFDCDGLSALKYGQMFSRTNVPRAGDWPFRGRASDIRREIFVVLLQNHLYQFLVRFLDQLLPEVGEADFPHLPTPIELPRSFTGPSGEVSFAAVDFEASYLPPKPLDLRRLLSICLSHALDATHRVQQLREDPTVWKPAVQELADHHWESLHDTDGKRRPEAGDPKEAALWNWHACNVALIAIAEAEFWLSLVDHLRVVSEMEGTFPHGTLWPRDYTLALVNLLQTLGRSFSYIAVLFSRGWSASPPLRRFYRRRPGQNSPYGGRVIVQLTECGQDAADAPFRTATTLKERGDPISHITWIFCCLAGIYNLHGITPSALLEELDHLLKFEPQAQSLVSPWVARKISDFTTLAECCRHLSGVASVVDALRMASEEFPSGGEQGFAAIFERCEILRTCVLVSDGWKYLNLAAMRVEHPIDGPHGKEDVDRIRAAEAAVDCIWDFLFQIINCTGCKLHVGICSALNVPVHRTCEWEETSPETQNDDDTLINFSSSNVAPADTAFPSSKSTSPEGERSARGATPIEVNATPKEEHALVNEPTLDTEPTALDEGSSAEKAPSPKSNDRPEIVHPPEQRIAPQEISSCVEGALSSEVALGERPALSNEEENLDSEGSDSAAESLYRGETKDAATNTEHFDVVDLATIMVFETLFSSSRFDTNPHAAARRRCTFTWPEFVHAMLAIGLRAEKRRGSAWMFGGASGPGVIIHEPFHGGKVPIIEARRWGMRIRRAFGYNRTTFLATIL